MGVHQGLMLLAMLLFSFCSPASFSPLSKNLVPVNTHENKEGIDEKDSIIGGGSTTINESKYTTALRASRGGGRARGNGGSLIPVYAAGGGGRNRIHINGVAPCGQGGFAVLIATSASILLHIFLYKF